MGHACLELHSTKGKKKEVSAKLKRTADLEVRAYRQSLRTASHYRVTDAHRGVRPDHYRLCAAGRYSLQIHACGMDIGPILVRSSEA
jgi:hypothetical protein